MSVSLTNTMTLCYQQPNVLSFQCRRAINLKEAEQVFPTLVPVFVTFICGHAVRMQFHANKPHDGQRNAHSPQPRLCFKHFIHCSRLSKYRHIHRSAMTLKQLTGEMTNSDPIHLITIQQCTGKWCVLKVKKMIL